MDIFLNIILLILGMAFLIKGADFFVEGSSNIARALKIPSLIIGLTLVSIGTSAPELSVSVTSAINGLNELSFSNVIGSNVFNVLIVLGLSASISPLLVDKEVYKFDLPIYFGICVILLLFALLGLSDGYQLTLWESIIIFALFFIYMAFLVIRGLISSKKTSNEEKEENKEEVIEENINIEEEKKGSNTFINKVKRLWHNKPWWLNVIILVVGLLGIIFGGQFVVDSASFLAKSFGMSDALVGLTIVSVGTSLPELITSLVAARKKENDIAVGNAIGSCIFNIVLILGLSSTIHPMTIMFDSIVDICVMLVSCVFIFICAIKWKKIGRIQGILLVLMYVGYLTYIITRHYLEI